MESPTKLLKDSCTNKKLNRLLSHMSDIATIYNDYFVNNHFEYKTKKIRGVDRLNVYYNEKDLMHLLGIHSYTKFQDKQTVMNFGALDFYKDILNKHVNIDNVYVTRNINQIENKLKSLKTNLKQLSKQNNSLKVGYNLASAHVKQMDILIQNNDLLLGIYKDRQTKLPHPKTVRSFKFEYNTLFLNCKKYPCLGVSIINKK